MKEKDKSMTNFQKIAVFLVIFGPIFLLSGVIYFAYSQLPELPLDFYEGNTSVEFCIGKCDDLDYLSSVNNTKYKFILCECVRSIDLGDGKYSSVASVNSVEYYFNSETYEKLTEKEVLKKINDV